MGKSWKNPHKVAAANKKGQVISKIAKEIAIAAKLGGADPGGNPRLRAAVDSARDASVPKDTIERAIKKGSGQLDDGKTIEEVMYEGYAAHQVGILVECQTDNRARTAPEIKYIFKKFGGQMGEPGGISWMFERVALIEGKLEKEGFDPDEEAIEAGADEVIKSEDDNAYSFYGPADDLTSIQTALVERGWDIKTCELSYKAKNLTDLTEVLRCRTHD